VVYRVVAISPGLDNGVASFTQEEPATDTAIDTNGFHLPGRVCDLFVDQRCSRTTLDALPTRHTNRIPQKTVPEGGDLKVIPTIGHVDGVCPGNFTTRPDTYAALDAFVGVEIKERIAGVDGQVFGDSVKAAHPALVIANAVHQRLQATLPAAGTEETVEIMVTEKEFKCDATNLVDFRIIRYYDHARLGRCPARRMQFLLSQDLDQADPTHPVGGHVRAVAQRGDIDPGLLRSIEDAHPFPRFYLHSVYEQRY